MLLTYYKKIVKIAEIWSLGSLQHKEKIVKQKQNAVGVVVGRFMVDELHEGQVALLQGVQQDYRRMAVLLGTHGGIPDNANPLPFEARAQMLSQLCPGATILEIRDAGDDELWSRRLDQLVEIAFPGQDIVMCGGRDSFLKQYRGKHQIREFPEVTGVSATNIRESITYEVRDDPMWRRGFIAGVNSQPPGGMPTGDLAILRTHKGKYQVILGKKDLDRKKWVFPGGFYDPVLDNSLLDTPEREGHEELPDVEFIDARFVGSTQIDDVRYHRGNRKIVTTFMIADYVSGDLTPGDDLKDACWCNVEDLYDHLEQHHWPLASMLCQRLGLSVPVAQKTKETA